MAAKGNDSRKRASSGELIKTLKDKLIKKFKDQQQRVKILISKILIKSTHQIP